MNRGSKAPNMNEIQCQFTFFKSRIKCNGEKKKKRKSDTGGDSVDANNSTSGQQVSDLTFL